MEKSFRDLAERHDAAKWVAMYESVRDAMDAYVGIRPNLNFSAGPAYFCSDFPWGFSTPLFEDDGPVRRAVTPVEQR